jgi:hypothetical protein
MFKKSLGIFFMLFLSITIFQKTASAKTSIFFDAGITKTSDGNANILEVIANSGFTNYSYYKPKISDSYESGTYRFGINSVNDNEITTKFQIKVLNQDDDIRLSSAGTSTSYLDIVDFSGSTSAKDASIDVDDEMVVVDINVGKNFSFVENFDSNVSAGLRYVDIKREQNRVFEGYNFGTVVAGTHSTSKLTEEFTGLGIRLGAEGRYGVVNGFGIFGEAGLSLLSGEKKTIKRQIDRDANTREDLRLEEDEIITVTDFIIGIDWKKEFSSDQSLTIGLGYEMEDWKNAFAHFYNDADAPIGISHDFSTDTFFLRITYGY